VIVADGALAALSPSSFVGPGGAPRLPEPLSLWFSANATISFIFGIAGGYVASTVGRDRGLSHASALCAILTIMSLVTLVMSHEKVPAWWTLGELAAGVTGVLLGGHLHRSRRERAAA